MKNLVVITGSSSTLGKNLIKKIIKNKNTFLLLHVNENKKKLINEINIKNNNFKIIKADFNQDSKIKYFIKVFQKYYNFKNISIIHLASSNLKIKKFKNYKWQDIVKQLSINLKSIFMILNNLINNNSKSNIKIIILLSKIIKDKPIPGTIDYTIAKFSLLGLVNSLNIEFRNDRISIDSISPPMFKSKMIKNLPLYIYQNIKSEHIISKVTKKILILLNQKTKKTPGKNYYI